MKQQANVEMHNKTMYAVLKNSMKSTVIKYANLTLLQSKVLNKHSSNIIHLISPVSVAVCKFNVSGFGCHPLAICLAVNTVYQQAEVPHIIHLFPQCGRNPMGKTFSSLATVGK